MILGMTGFLEKTREFIFFLNIPGLSLSEMNGAVATVNGVLKGAHASPRCRGHQERYAF